MTDPDEAHAGKFIRSVVREEFRNIGIFSDDDEGLRATRLNFEWVDTQRRNDAEIQDLMDWVRHQKRHAEEAAATAQKRSEENSAEVRRAFFVAGAEWIWHLVSAALAGGVTYFFSTRGH